MTFEYERDSRIRQSRRSLEFFDKAGLQRLTGLPTDKVYEFVTKECIDNGLDKDDTKNITVSVAQGAGCDELSITDDGRQEFTEQDVTKLLQFDYAPSSKRGLKTISRGILGNALPCMIGWSRVSWNNKGPEHTFIISSGGRKFLIHAVRENDEITSQVKTEDVQNDGITTITLLLPPKSVKVNEVRDIVRHMHWVNGHANFSLAVNGKAEYFKAEDGGDDPLVKWRGRAGNVRYYTEDEIIVLAESFGTTGSRIDKFFSLFDGFRDRRYLQEPLSLSGIAPDAKLSELNEQEICKVFQELQGNSVKPSARILPALGKGYFMKLLGRSFVRYKKISGMYEDDDGQCIPWLVELVSFKDAPEVYQFVNFSFAGSKRPFTNWSYPDHEEKLISLETLVEKRELALIIHAISPCFEWEDAGKGKLDVLPFGGKLANAVKNVLKQTRTKSDEQIELLREVLRKRVADVRKDPTVVERDPWTQSTVFYITRNLSDGINLNRKYLTQLIRQECKSLGYTREQLGIYAADRAQLFYRREVYPVSIKNIDALMMKGTDILCIEKEGVAEVLAPFAAKYGIAVLNSRGFLVEYAERLLELAERHGGNLAIITDLDAAGLLIAQSVGMLDERLAVNIDTVEKIGIHISQVEEDYKPKENHLSQLRRSLDRTNPEIFRYILHKRVEIDSIIAHVKAERFWKYLLEELRRMHPTRDYTRAIEANTGDFMNKLVQELCRPLIDAGVKRVNGLRKSYFDNRRKVRGFLDVAKEEENLAGQTHKKLNRDKKIARVVRDIGKVLKTLEISKKRQF